MAQIARCRERYCVSRLAASREISSATRSSHRRLIWPKISLGACECATSYHWRRITSADLAWVRTADGPRIQHTHKTMPRLSVPGHRKLYFVIFMVCPFPLKKFDHWQFVIISLKKAEKFILIMLYDYKKLCLGVSFCLKIIVVSASVSKM